jgi:hypothetical protein
MNAKNAIAKSALTGRIVTIEFNSDDAAYLAKEAALRLHVGTAAEYQGMHGILPWEVHMTAKEID